METKATSTTPTPQATATTDNKAKQNNISELFDKLQKENTNPRDISYEDYKKLTRKEINELYPKDTMKDKNNEATSLHIKANMTDDEALNKVLFKKELESLESIDAKSLKPANEILNNVFEAWTSISHISMSWEAIRGNFETIAMKSDYTKDCTMQEYSYEFSKGMKITFGSITKSVSYNYTALYTADKGLTSSGVFKAFDLMQNQFKEIINKHDYKEDSHFRQESNTVIKYHEDIKNEYEKKVKENDTLLYTHTRSYSYSKMSYLSYSFNMEDVNSNEDIKSKDIKQSISNILSMIKDAEVGSDFEDLKKALLEIKQMDNSSTKATQELRDKHEKEFTDERFDRLLDNLNIKNLTKEDKELYKSIISDRHISNEEIKDLSYEQMQTLNKFLIRENPNDEYIQDTIASKDYKAGILLRSTTLNEDDSFNKIVFDKLKDMNDEEISVYMLSVNGIKSDRFKDMSSNEDKDPKGVLDNLISQTQSKLDSQSGEKNINLYKNILNIYLDLFKEYEEKLNKTKESKDAA